MDILATALPALSDAFGLILQPQVLGFLVLGVVMGLAVIGYYTQNVYFLYFVLFLMGAQSAMFAPIKYSVLPQYLHRDELMGGNGLVQGFTFLAIIFGTIIGNELILREGGVLIVSIFVVSVAIVGFISSLYTLPALPIVKDPPPVDWFFPRAIYKLVGECRRESESVPRAACRRARSCPKLRCAGSRRLWERPPAWTVLPDEGSRFPGSPFRVPRRA